MKRHAGAVVGTAEVPQIADGIIALRRTENEGHRSGKTDRNDRVSPPKSLDLRSRRRALCSRRRNRAAPKVDGCRDSDVKSAYPKQRSAVLTGPRSSLARDQFNRRDVAMRNPGDHIFKLLGYIGAHQKM